MRRLPFLPLLQRFQTVAQSEGRGVAIRRALGYLRRRITGAGASVFGRGSGGAPVPDAYLHGIWQTLAQAEAFHVTSAPALNRNRRQIAMIADLNLPQCRKYRVEQLAAFWRSREVEFDYAHFQDLPRAVRILQQATHLMEYRLQTGPVAEMLRYEAHRLRLPILYDLDDPLFSVSAYETYGNMKALDPGMKQHFLREAPKYLEMMNGADILSVSTPGMAEHAALYSNRPVFLRRNFADEETLGIGAAQECLGADDLFRVAFSSGSQGHEVDFQEVLEPLTDFLMEAPNRRLMILGHFDLSLLPQPLLKRVERHKFTDYGQYLGTLMQADCAIMPLADDAFNRCKSAVRVLDAGAVGLPSIVSDVGDLPEVLRPGLTGFVARSDQDWLAALRQLAADPKAASQMGQQSRQELERRWQASDAPHIIAPELLEWVTG